MNNSSNIFERRGWTITIETNDELFQAKCQSQQGQIIHSKFYTSIEKAIEAGEIIVDREWEKEQGIKRKIELDIEWLVSIDFSQPEIEYYPYLDLKEGVLVVYPDDFEQEELEDDELEFSDRYLSIPEDISKPGQDMRDFIDTLEDETLRIKVENAFYKGGKGRFRRVKNIVGHNFKAFQYEQREKRLKKWLESENLAVSAEINS